MTRHRGWATGDRATEGGSDGGAGELQITNDELQKGGNAGEGGGPAAVGVDGSVDLGHEADGFVQGHDDAVVVGDVVGGEHAALAVLEPLGADLVAADVEVPHVLGHASEASRLL